MKFAYITLPRFTLIMQEYLVRDIRANGTAKDMAEGITKPCNQRMKIQCQKGDKVLEK